MKENLMTASSLVTSNEIVVRMTAEDRDVVRIRKGKRTYAEFYFDVKEGKIKRIPTPARKKGHVSYVGVKLYLTDEQYAFVVADAEKRGINVSKAIRADIFLPPKNPAPATRSEALRLKNTVPTPVRDALEVLMECDEYSDLKEATESVRFLTIAGSLILREAKVKP